MRGEKAKADSNENETYVFSWMTAEKNLVETRGKIDEWECEAIHIF